MPYRAAPEWKSLCEQPVLRLRKLPDGEFTPCANRGWDGQVLDLEWTDEAAPSALSPGDFVEIESSEAYCLGEATACAGRQVFVFVEQIVNRAEVERIGAHWKAHG